MNANPAWLAAGWTMIHLGWVGLAIALIAAIGRRLLKTASPEARYGLALAALLSLAVSPVVVFARVYEPVEATVATSSKSVAIEGTNAVEPRPMPSMPARLPSIIRSTEQTPSIWTLDRLAVQLPWAWLVGSMVSMASLATGLIGVHRLRRSSVAVDTDFDRRCQALARAIGVAGRVGVAACDRLVSPVLIGILRPMILLPPSAFDVWTWEQVEMALLHELAHLKRWDNHVNILQRVVESVLFFHPATWWLSGWVRLERELCCDRLVVDRLGRPRAYASMLASLAGLKPRPATPLGMANHEVMTRIRWILDPKDRAMTMTLPEGLGLIAATVVGLGLAIGTHAKPPENPSEPVKLALRKAIDEADANDDGKRNSRRSTALVDIAGMQLNLGDREGALASIDKATKAADRPTNRPGEEMNRITELAQIAQVRREAGDLDGAQAMLVRIVDAIEAMKPPRLRDRLAWAVGFVKALASDDEEVQSYIEDPNQTFGGFRAGMMAAMAEERIKMGDLDAARPLVRRAVVLIRAESGQVASMYLGSMPPILAKAGDMAGAREILEEFRKAAMAKPDADARATALSYLAKSFAEIGDIGPALDLARSLEDPKFRVYALDRIVDALGEQDRDDPYATCIDMGGIKVVVGAVGQKPKDRDFARKVLPDVARAVIEMGASVPLKQARTLTTIAHLQAMAGDLEGAKATAMSIPDIKRSAFPGPSTGLYDAIKPATLAIVARIANDPDLFRRAVDLARSIEAEDQSIVARLVIAREQTTAGRKDDAIVGLKELVPIALRQAEPRRSRALSMVASEQARAGDLVGAASTADTIRDYPGLEKHQALCHLADGLKKAGDKAAEAKALREALRIVQAKPPEHPSMGAAVNMLNAFASFTFVDPDLEFNEDFFGYDRDSLVPNLMVKLGDVDGAIRLAREGKGYQRDNTLKDIAGLLAAQGDIQAALDLARSIESAEGRLEAVDRIAQSIKPVLPFPATLHGPGG